MLVNGSFFYIEVFGMVLKGRREIFTDVAEITKENVSDVLQEAFSLHAQSAREIEYLQKYERGKHLVLREEIHF